MKSLLFLHFYTLSIFFACSQTSSSSFIGRIYILESQETFFQITSKDSVTYYTINEFGEQKVKKHKATWNMLNDSTIRLNVVYSNSENVEFILNYNEENDYWIDDDYISAYRRMKRIKFNDFELSE